MFASRPSCLLLSPTAPASRMPRQSQRAKEKKAKDAVPDVSSQEIPASMLKLSATRGLQEALALQNHTQVYYQIRQSMRSLADKIFDFGVNATRPSEEQWKRYQDELYEMYPRFKRRPQEQVFFFVRKYTKQYIGFMRWRNRKQILQSETTDNKESINEVPDATSETSRSPLRSIPVVSNAPSQSVVSQMHYSDVTILNSQTSPSCPPAYKDARSDPSLSPLTLLQEFLSTCHPPLVHLLPSFVEIGFRDDKMFEEVLTWPMYEMVAALDKWHALGFLTPLDRETLRISFVQKQKRVFPPMIMDK